MQSKDRSIFSLAVIVASLGYFVDMYDLLLFTIVKRPSLLAVGSTDSTLLPDSIAVMNWQMIGLLLGGILWGVLGDKKGRLSILFGSIILYSVANFATAYIHTVDQYIICRFIAGIGLAGELGAGITLVSELLPQSKRGIGTSVVAGFGLTGVIAAYFTYQVTLDWRLCYQIGGVLGILLLFLRVSLVESGMFSQVKLKDVSKGNFFRFFSSRVRFKKYFTAILLGLPTWCIIGILVTQSDRFAKAMFGSTDFDAGRAVMLAYVGIAIGDLIAGFVCQYFQSRKKGLLLYYTLCALSIMLFFSGFNTSNTSMAIICALLGFSSGFWIIFITMGAEQFGTNLRATATTTIPNMVRGSLPLINMMFLNLFQKDLGLNIIKSGIYTAAIVIVITLTALYFTEETYHKDLDYIE